MNNKKRAFGSSSHPKGRKPKKPAKKQKNKKQKTKKQKQKTQNQKKTPKPKKTPNPKKKKWRENVDGWSKWECCQWRKMIEKLSVHSGDLE